MSEKPVFQNLRVAYTTLGCKLNFAETSSLRDQLARQGAFPAEKGEHADICIVNTCSVTDVADHKCRQAINRMVREHPGAFVVVMGCYAQLQADQIAGFLTCRLTERMAQMTTIAASHARPQPTYSHSSHQAESSRAAIAHNETISITPYGSEESQAQSLNSGQAPNSGYLPVADNMMAEITLDGDHTADSATPEPALATASTATLATAPAPASATSTTQASSAAMDSTAMSCMGEDGRCLHDNNMMVGGICEECLNSDGQTQGPCARNTQEIMTQVTALAGGSYAHISEQELNQSFAQTTNTDPLNAEGNAVDGSFNPELYQRAQLAHSKMSPIDAANCPCWHNLHWEESTSHQRLLYALTNDSVKRADFNLVLSDSPAYTVAVNQLSEDNFDLMLTGSTYGGMAPLLSGWVKNSNGGFLSGLYSITNRMQLYVSSGTNCWAPAPIRLGNSGEITLITVHSRAISDEMRSQRIYNFN